MNQHASSYTVLIARHGVLLINVCPSIRLRLATSLAQLLHRNCVPQQQHTGFSDTDPRCMESSSYQLYIKMASHQPVV